MFLNEKVISLILQHGILEKLVTKIPLVEKVWPFKICFLRVQFAKFVDTIYA